MANTHIINGILVKIFLEERTNYDGIKILLSNRESASLFDQPKFNMEGVSLEAANHPAGYSLYRLKLHELHNLEHDPHFRSFIQQYIIY